ncbi:hypothetical protein Mapa_006168 [Marchantia paleacea]|nr:hypothetical protein Mapa_006168 [Marchantia paleacea]
MAMALSSACSCASQAQGSLISSATSTSRRWESVLSVPKLGSGVFDCGLGRESLKRSTPVAGPFVKSRSSAGLTVRATVAVEEAPARVDLYKLKADLLAAVAGLDRGLVAEEADEFAANAAALKLEAAADALQLPEDLDKLQGRWRLIFSSGFSSGSYGGQRPGPNIARSPFSLGSVYQRIDVVTRELDNIVDLRFPAPWPLPPLEVTATLAHSFELAGGSKIRLIFEKTFVKPAGALSEIPQFELPTLPQFVRGNFSNNSRGTGEFETTYLDKDFRISRGDRGELRIFVKV